jgi:hypothetical protein
MPLYETPTERKIMSETATVVELPAKPRRLSKKFIVTVAVSTAVAVAAVALKKNLASEQDEQETTTAQSA